MIRRERQAAIMTRPKKFPEYNADRIQKELIEAVTESYEENGELNITANEFGLSALKIRKAAIELLRKKRDEDALWSAIIAFQGYPFHTYSGLPFFYKIPVGRKGLLNKELLVDRRDKSKSLTWSSVMLAYEKIRELDGQIVEKPKNIGDIRGISYIYPIFYRFGLIDVPEKVAARMELKSVGN